LNDERKLKLFGKKNQNTVNLADSVWGDYNRLNELDNTLLTRPFTEEEVKKVVFSMHPDSAPGPDGFSIAFYRGCWEIIKQDLMNMVNDFYLGKLDIKRLNYGVITLIPKVKNAMDVKQYRPICLLKVSFKIFTKLLLDRLEGIVDKLISNSQTTFIKGHYILDGAVILHETLHELSQKKLKGVVMKIGFEKAYDSINWNFVEGVLIRKGFSPKLTEWIMSTVRGGKVCININGENGQYFRTHRGLRQGDLFISPTFQSGSRRFGPYFGKSQTERAHTRGASSYLLWGFNSSSIC